MEVFLGSKGSGRGIVLGVSRPSEADGYWRWRAGRGMGYVVPRLVSIFGRG